MLVHTLASPRAHDRAHLTLSDRWEVFRAEFLKKGVVSPLGRIARTFWRQEDQARLPSAMHVLA